MFSYSNYNKFYNKAKTSLVQKHKEEHKKLMIELGYKNGETKEVKKTK